MSVVVHMLSLVTLRARTPIPTSGFLLSHLCLEASLAPWYSSRACVRLSAFFAVEIVCDGGRVQPEQPLISAKLKASSSRPDQRNEWLMG